MQTTPWVAPLRIPEQNSGPCTPEWLELSTSPVTTGSTNEDISPWYGTPNVPMPSSSFHNPSTTSHLNWPDTNSPPPGPYSRNGHGASAVASWQGATASGGSRQTLPRCAVVSFQKDGDSVRWHPAAPSNNGGLGARVRGFDRAFELEEFSSHAIQGRYVDLRELLVAIAAENQPHTPCGHCFHLRRRANQILAPCISAPPSNFAQRAISLPLLQRNYEERNFESMDPRQNRLNSEEFEVERPHRGLFAKIRRRVRTRAFVRRFWRSYRFKT